MADEIGAAAQSPDASARLVEFARACQTAARAVSLYPPGHPAIAAALRRLAELTDAFTRSDLWITAGGPSLDIDEIDYADVLRERLGVAAAASEIIAAALSGPSLELDESGMQLLLDLVQSPGKLQELVSQLERVGREQGADRATPQICSVMRQADRRKHRQLCLAAMEALGTMGGGSGSVETLQAALYHRDWRAPFGARQCAPPRRARSAASAPRPLSTRSWRLPHVGRLASARLRGRSSRVSSRRIGRMA